jgi:hypothetical protein
MNNSSYDYVAILLTVTLIVISIFATLAYKLLVLALEYWRLDKEFNMRELTHYNFTNISRPYPIISSQPHPPTHLQSPDLGVNSIAQLNPSTAHAHIIHLAETPVIPQIIAPVEDSARTVEFSKPSIQNFRQTSLTAMNLPAAETKCGIINADEANMEVVDV